MPTSHPYSAVADGFGIFAGAALLTVGFFQVQEGAAAVAGDEVLLRTPNYAFELDLSTWGWIHLVIGLAVAVVGGAVLIGRTWAVVAGIVLAAVSALTNFAWLPHYPFWAVLVIAFDVAVIGALSTMLGGPRDRQAEGASAN